MDYRYTGTRRLEPYNLYVSLFTHTKKEVM